MSSDMPNIQALQQQFQQDGYAVVPNFLSPEACQNINVALQEHFQTEQTTKASTTDTRFGCDILCWNPVQEGHELFTKLMGDQGLANYTEALLGPGYQHGAAHTLVMASLLGGVGQAWHQDCPATNPEHYNLNRLLYTTDITAEDGAVVVVPGSHLRGRIPCGSDQETMPGEVMLTPAAGTLVLVHGHCFHRVTPNTSGRPRISINFRAMPATSPADVCRVGVYRNVEVDFVTGAATQLP